MLWGRYLKEQKKGKFLFAEMLSPAPFIKERRKQ